MPSFKTDRLYLAAYLMAKGHPLVDLIFDPKQPQRVIFCFEANPRLKKHLRRLFEDVTDCESPAIVEYAVELMQWIRTLRRRQVA